MIAKLAATLCRATSMAVRASHLAAIYLRLNPLQAMSVPNEVADIVELGSDVIELEHQYV